MLSLVKKIIIKHKKEFYIILSILLYVLFIGDCLVKKITGFPCPTCGLTRSVISLLKGDLYTSIHYHLFTIPMMIGAVIYLLKDMINEKIIRYVFLVIIVLCIIYYIYRMCIYFPLLEPMNYNYNSYLFKILKFKYLLF